MSDWRKILVAYIKHIEGCEGKIYFPDDYKNDPLKTDLTEMERESLAAAMREARDGLR